jgi:hypothetical protein
MQNRRLLTLFALLFVFGQQLHAQVKVDMRVDRRLYITYEPILVTVAITNLSGHDLTLSDADGQKWFSFQVVTGDGRIIPPVKLDYKLLPLTIPAGVTLKRSVNLTSLYGVQETGLYRVKASIYSHESEKYTSSPSDEFQVTEGKLFWQQTVGVPEDLQVPGEGTHRTISLLTFRLPKDNMLYVRVEDDDAGIVYTTSPLGRVLIQNDPDVKLDKNNQLHVLQLVGAKTYVYSRIGLNGEFQDQLTYNASPTAPYLKKDADGDVFVRGGQLDKPASTGPNAPNVPKVSDRPAGFPQP